MGILLHPSTRYRTNPEGGWEYPLFLAVVAGVQALLGDGAYALGSRSAESAPAATAGRFA